jgi:Zn-dependent protease with chaperone function
MIDEFALSSDLEACRAIDAIPLLTKAAEWVNSVWVAPQTRAEMLGNGVRISPEQLPRIHQILKMGTRRLGAQCPELYVKQDPTCNALTLGTNQDPIVVINSALLDTLDLDELAFVICHELGHVKCRHVTYLTIAYMSVHAAGLFGNAYFFALPAVVQEWSRRMEFTADRAGLIGCADLAVSIRALVMLALGSRKFLPEFNLPAYLSQARETDRFWGHLNKWINLLDHPYLASRVRSLVEFAGSAACCAVMRKLGPCAPRGRNHYQSLPAPVTQSQAGPCSGAKFCRCCGFELDKKQTVCAVCGSAN